jgi:hypothetical protein
MLAVLDAVAGRRRETFHPAIDVAKIDKKEHNAFNEGIYLKANSWRN